MTNKWKKNGVFFNKYGSKEWYKHGKLHREDGPAVECTNGTKYWYLNGNLHRVGVPAIIWANGSKEWWVDGEFIRFGGVKTPTNSEKNWRVT